MMSMPCLIMQYKPYIVELPPTKEAYNTDCKKKYVAIALLGLHICIHLFSNCGITLYAHRKLQMLVSSFRV